jgi:hypothetical protein
VRPEERDVLERAIQRVTEQAANADAIVDEAMAAGLEGSDRIVVSTKMLRTELLSVKADLERELEKAVLDASSASYRCTTSAASASGPVTGRMLRRRRTRRRSLSERRGAGRYGRDTAWTSPTALTDAGLSSDRRCPCRALTREIGRG